MNILTKAGLFLRAPLAEKLHLAAAFVLLGLSALALRLVPFRFLAARLGASSPDAGSARVPRLDAAREEAAREVGRAVRRAARWTPWASRCLAQALAARVLLGLRGIPCVVFLGMARDPETGALKAHAWTAAGDARVTGGDGREAFAVVGAFTPR